MTPDRWARLKGVVADALDRPAGDRDAFLDDACAGDAGLRREAGELAAAAGEETWVIDRRTDAALGHDAADADPAGLAGRTMGPFELIEPLGQGATGAVYLARQRGVERPAAVKVLRGAALGYDAPRRFAREVRALGRIEHDGVAKIYDAGAEPDPSDPRRRPTPWIAMEYVDGLPLTRHAEVHALGLRDRLRLLAGVAEAVHAAHQKAVVHRDLKPGNVLVTAEGRPKVLDFGIARIIERSRGGDADDEEGPPVTLRTTAGVLLGTLGYMAPEQARGDAEAADVRSDVFALGAMLHELAVGRLPTPTDDLPLTERLRRLAEPDVTPATIGSIAGDDTGGDLHTVLTTALAAEPDRRYASAEALAEDVRRLLDHEPIDARPPTRRYLARKFVRRHRAGVAAGAAVSLALIAGAAASTVGFAREASARRQAEAARREAEAAGRAAERALAQSELDNRRGRAARAFLTRVVEAAEVTGDPEITLLDAVLAAEPELLDYADGDELTARDLRLTLGRTLLGLGRLEEADRQYALAEEHARRGSPARLTPVEVALERAGNLANHELIDRARAAYDPARAAVERVAADAGASRVERDDLPRLRLTADTVLASILNAEGDYAGSADAWRSAIEVAEARVDPQDPEGRGGVDAMPVGELMTIRSNAASAMTNAGQYPEAIALLEAVVAWRRREQGDSHPDTLIARHNLAYAHAGTGRRAEAERESRAVLAAALDRTGEGHPLVHASRGLLVDALIGRDDAATAEALDLTRARVAAARANDDGGAALPLALDQRGRALTFAGRPAEAVGPFGECLSLTAERLGDLHPFALSARANLAVARAESGDGDAAASVAELTRVLALQRGAMGRDSEPAAMTLNAIARLHLRAGDGPAAAEAAADAVGVAGRRGYATLLPAALLNLGRAHLAAGDLAAAEAALVKSHAAGTGDDAARAAEHLAEVFDAKGDAASAEAWRARSLGHD